MRPAVRPKIVAAVRAHPVVLTAVAGVISGAVLASISFAGPLRPLAHLLSPWILFAVIVSTRLSGRRAALRATVGLVAAVSGFSLAQTVLDAVRSDGAAFGTDLAALGVGTALAVLGGVTLGAVFHRIGHSDWSGAAATATASGLVIAETYRRASAHLDGNPVLLLFMIIALTVIGLLAATTARQTARTAVLVLPLAVLGYLLLSLPDLIGQLGVHLG